MCLLIASAARRPASNNSTLIFLLYGINGVPVTVRSSHIVGRLPAPGRSTVLWHGEMPGRTGKEQTGHLTIRDGYPIPALYRTGTRSHNRLAKDGNQNGNNANGSNKVQAGNTRRGSEFPRHERPGAVRIPRYRGSLPGNGRRRETRRFRNLGERA